MQAAEGPCFFFTPVVVVGLFWATEWLERPTFSWNGLGDSPASKPPASLLRYPQQCRDSIPGSVSRQWVTAVGSFSSLLHPLNTHGLHKSNSGRIHQRHQG